MARKTDVRYIQFYTDGSAACRVEPAFPSRELPGGPQSKRRRKKVLCIDPMAWCAAAVAVLMLVLMAVGCMRLRAANAQHQQMQQYLEQLEAQNKTLHQEYDSGYQLEDVQEKAEALGMIPVEEAEKMTITLELS